MRGGRSCKGVRQKKKSQNPNQDKSAWGGNQGLQGGKNKKKPSDKKPPTEETARRRRSPPVPRKAGYKRPRPGRLPRRV